MTFTASGLYYLNFKDILMNDSAIDLVADSIKVALYTNSITTPNFDTNTGYSAAPYNANEVGTPAGGIAVGSPAFSVSSGTLSYTVTNTAWGSQSFSNARGCLVYDDTIAAPTAKPCIAGVTFGADFSVTSGVFTIAWTASTIFSIDLVP